VVEGTGGAAESTGGVAGSTGGVAGSGGATGGAAGATQTSDGPTGFARVEGLGLATTTGGGDATPELATDCDSLVALLEDNTPRVVHIPNGPVINCETEPRAQRVCAVLCDPGVSDQVFYDIPGDTEACEELDGIDELTLQRTERSINVGSNKTLLGLGAGATLHNTVLDLEGSSNIIIRNLAIESVNPTMLEAGDGITLEDSHHIWIDHCRFREISDGHVDIAGSAYVTLSWNFFDGLNSHSCGGQHLFTTDVDDSMVTFHHNYYYLTGGRNPALDGPDARIHLFNNYWNGVNDYCIAVGGEAQALVEGNIFVESSRPHWSDDGYIGAPEGSNLYEGISADPAETKDSGDPVLTDLELYPYTLDPVEEVRNSVVSGAGPR
jgi:pectate lyase